MRFLIRSLRKAAESILASLGGMMMIGRDVEDREFPQAVGPAYHTPKADAEILLYEGSLNLHHGDRVFSGRGKVTVSWRPVPQVAFEMRIEPAIHVNLFDNQSKLELVERQPGQLVDARVTGSELFIGQPFLPVTGAIHNWLEAADAPIQQLVFHVPNFRKCKGDAVQDERGYRGGRATAEFGGWNIVIDEISDKLAAADLKATGGYALTHVGRLQRSDGGSFKAQEARGCLEGLDWFLSFCNGRWTGPILAVGYDENSIPVAHQWKLPRITPYGRVRSWYSEHGDDYASRAYPGFAKLWSDDAWMLTVKSAIYWYIIANTPGGAVENGVMLAHVAFDTLGWTLFVEHLKSLSGKHYDDLSADEKLRRLLNYCGIPLAVPAELRRLASIATSEGWNDGPAALASIRNAYVHPTRKNRRRLERVGDEAEHQACDLPPSTGSASGARIQR
jgi:hypothetical protein